MTWQPCPLAGIPVRNDLTLALAELLANADHDRTARVLILALEHERAVVALTIADRDAILAVPRRSAPTGPPRAREVTARP
jgi:hypothetical protein